MFSIICSVYNKDNYKKYLLPSLKRVEIYLKENNLKPLQIIEVNGAHSLTSNYNKGLKKAKYSIKFYIHEDVDIMDYGEIPLFVEIANKFKEDSNIALIGLVGTKKSGKGLWWTEHGKEYIYGSMLTFEDKILWKWNTDFIFTNVEIIDGYFMATNHNILWSEDIKGFHFYDCDYSNTLRLKYKKKILVFNHRAFHLSSGNWENEEFFSLEKYYNTKWKNKFL